MTWTAHWFRHHHGTVNDPKWGTVLAKCHAMSRHVTPNSTTDENVTMGVCRIRKSDILAVWSTMEELASASDVRGTMQGWSVDDVATNLGLTEAEVDLIYTAMQGKVLEGLRLLAWDKRQPKREREDATAAKRKAKQRENVTPSHAKSHQSSPGHTMSPTEERRGEEKSFGASNRSRVSDTPYSVETLSQAREFENLDEFEQADVRAFYEQAGNVREELPVKLVVLARFLAHVRQSGKSSMTAAWHKQLLVGMIEAKAKQTDINAVLETTIEAGLSRPLWDSAPRGSPRVPQSGFHELDYTKGIPHDEDRPRDSPQAASREP